MKTWYRYTTEIKNYKPKVVFSFVLCLEVGTNILEEGRFYLDKGLEHLIKRDSKNIEFINTGDLVEYFRSSKDKHNFPFEISNLQEIINTLLYPFEDFEKRKLNIFNIEEIEGCMGCCYDSLGQNSHMECPNGCLHDSLECYNCNIFMKTKKRKRT